MLSKISFAALALPLAVTAQQTVWGQCGGIGWSGATTCTSGNHCVQLNSYYYQCQPGAASSSSTTLSTVTSSSAPTTSTPGSTKTTTSTPSTTIPGSTPSGTGPGSTLQSNYYWIRAVESPNFHKYLQTNPQYTTGTAILDSYTTAGQFNIVNGQLVELIDPSKGTLLYANVQQPADSSVNKLAVTFTTTPNTFGTFAFSGDAVQWSTPSINRPNLSAWLVCANQQLFINLGPYDYDTPAGCADETIHYYNGATAVD
jgi:hypothetical protein